MRPGIERSRRMQGVAAPACLVITPTVEQALSAAEQARLLLADDSLRVVPVTSATRARRVLAAGPVAIVTGTAADLLKMAVIEMWRRRSEFPEFRLSALIHDEIMGSVPLGLEQSAAAWLKGIMIEVGNKLIDPIPVDAEVKIGPTWGG
jgi:hypothetical protein